ncbi:sulfatase-like hydrolase/transferase [Geminicoccaceae bacterium 1502E]|nr:sulfatase-like hydrolase/transferase [Geminicoccaceae bacterium 1502E]
MATAGRARAAPGLAGRTGAFPLLLAWAVATLCASGLELVLIEVKYEVFRGGFLQSHRLVHWPQRLAFSGLVLLVHAWLAGLGLVWFTSLARRIARDRHQLAFGFLFTWGCLATAALTARYQLLAYFSDAVSFGLLRDLAGGSIATALLYVADELSLMLAMAAAMAAALLLGRRTVRALLPPAPLADGPPLPRPWPGLLVLAAMLLPLAALLLPASRDADLEAALRKSLAYEAVVGLLNGLTDVDRDGYGLFGRLPDSHPFDAARHPMAFDRPANGIDEDGFAGDFQLPADEPAGAASVDAVPVVPAPRPNLFLVVLESTRGDVVGRRLDGRLVAPNLTALARRGSLLDAVHAHEAFTVPAMKSLLTGSLAGERPARSLFRVLQANGYRTSIFSGMAEGFGGIAETVGQDGRNEIMLDAVVLKDRRALTSTDEASLRIDSRILLDELETRLGEADWSAPRFVYLNFQEAHFPYAHPGMPMRLGGLPIPRASIGADQRAWLERTYLNAVAAADAQLGRLLAFLEARGLMEGSLVAVVGDHGEALFEEGYLGHGHRLDDAQTRTALVLSRPGFDSRLPLGQEEVRDVLLRAMGAEPPPALPRAPRGGVFQLIGDLESPAQIGMVEPDGRRTILDPASREVFFSEQERWLPYDALAPASAGRERADRLVQGWELRRWRRRQARPEG